MCSVQAEPLNGRRSHPGPLDASRLRVARFEPARLTPASSCAPPRVSGSRCRRSQFDLGEVEDVAPDLRVSALARWWPWDQGEPWLYRLTVRLEDERGPVDEVETVVGVRTVRRERFANGAAMALHGQRPPGLPARGELGARRYSARPG